MGLQIGDLVTRREVTFNDLKGKTIAIDAFNAIYQFLSSVRQPDGTPLQDSQGRVTSHLSGLFYRNVALLSEGIKLIYVFDGEYHILKDKTHEKRQEAKDTAELKFRTALEEEDLDAMEKYAKGTSKLDSKMVAESKELLDALGICVIQAPGEGEMQAADFVKRGEAYAVGSQDYDALVVGGTRLIQNLTLARKRRTVSGFVYIAPEMIEYENVINQLGVTGDQLICLAILVGTDFNPGGIKGIGPKKALDLVKRRKYPVSIFEEVVERYGEIGFNWREVFEIFKKPNVSKQKVEFPKIDEEKIKEILVERHEFSKERVEKQLERLREFKRKSMQKTLF
ncbi:MAG: flap endonuclease-1 [Candidatus Pacearchaeota archaeon]|nr:flap endonuclease-1 [Candidatus Pacearchaeota archaeon]